MKYVLVSGVFDIFHFGHMNMLEQATDIALAFSEENDGVEVGLLVGVINDKDAEEYKRRPILTMEERIKSIQYWSRYHRIPVEIYPNTFVSDLKDKIYEKYDIVKVIHGHSEEEEKYYAAFYQQAIKRGIYQVMEYTPEISTSEIIARIKN